MLQNIMIALTVSVGLLMPALAQFVPNATVTFPSSTKDGSNVPTTSTTTTKTTTTTTPSTTTTTK